MKTHYLFLILLISTTSLFAQKSRWALPDFGVVQYAGSIGYFSAGLGYEVFKSNARFSTHFGVVPKNRGGTLNIVAVKLIFKPKTYELSNRLRFSPFDVGLMGSFHYGDNFETRWPEGVHPKGYYWWHPALRAHLIVESSVNYKFGKGRRFQSLSGYIEFNTNELYMVSFIQNLKTVRVTDIVKAGTGLRLNF